jgi:hypothetical protein
VSEIVQASVHEKLQISGKTPGCWYADTGKTRLRTFIIGDTFLNYTIPYGFT